MTTPKFKGKSVINEQSPEESAMEESLIKQLTQGASQWTRRNDLKTIPQLWDNFFTILQQHNQQQLHDVPLTDGEKAMIKSQITQATFFKASEFMIGANHKVSFHLNREDSKLPSANLLILDNLDISGGSSVYEVVNQVEVPKKVGIDQNRRFDVSLLINGLPFIHIELKTHHHPYKEAFNQIQKYINEGKFMDIYCFVKMFVVTNGTNTRYISAAQELNSKFLTSWVDTKNKAVNNYLDFAKDVLSIPAAHHMVADYNVLDDEARKIIMLRPYQVHAIQSIFKASRNGQSGFIWHTTGSGKTLTSYKVARNLLQIPSIDKTIFLIDRSDLDTQTSTAFKTYANNDTISVENTSNSYKLANQLSDDNRNVVVTTKQKLQSIFRRIDESPDDSKKYQKLKNKHFAFVVDECHRTVSPTQKRELDKFFNQEQLWYGFTGTPLFAENARKENGQDARTTEQLYGPCLHTYTIEDAIRDKMVLGFKTESFGSDYEDLDNDKLDKIYLSDAHMETVVNNVLKLAYRKQGIMYNQRYSAIFTTSSIHQAQKYYKLFKQTIAKGGVPKKIKEIYPDFPRVAITYSVTQNDDGSEFNQNEMKSSIEDYNKMFDRAFGIETLDAYNRDVNLRLAGKQGSFANDINRLDIVIVVDRLLTGFDAPSLSALYIDRRPMKPQNIIQALSRTNRLYDKDKTWGQIVTFQYRNKFEKAIDNALLLYSNGGGTKAIAPDWKTSKERYLLSQGILSDLIDKYPDIADITNADEEERISFAKIFRIFDKDRAAIQTYEKLDEDPVPEFSTKQLEDMQGSYENIVADLKVDDDDDDSIDVDTDYELESFHVKEINVNYIVNLMNSYLPQGDNNDNPITERDDQNVKNVINNMKSRNPNLSSILDEIWDDLKMHRQDYESKDIGIIVDTKVDQKIDNIIIDFAKRFSLNYSDLRYVIEKYNPEIDNSHQEGMVQLLNHDFYEKFKINYPNSNIPNLLKWKKTVRTYLKELYENKIEPLMHIN